MASVYFDRDEFNLEIIEILTVIPACGRQADSDAFYREKNLVIKVMENTRLR